MSSAPYTSDTLAEALAVQLECLRKMPPQERIRRTFALSRQVRRMARDAIRRRHPDLDERGVKLLFIELTFGKTLAGEVRSLEHGARPLSELNDLVDALAPVVAAFRALEIRHFVSGSVASSFHGATRTTMDVDVVCELTEDRIASFIEFFDRDFYLSDPAIREAVRRKSCFNLIHLPTSFKVDVFVSRGRPFDREAMQRASPQNLGEDRKLDVPVASAEDSIISKLEWYRFTNETSERQWDDVSRLIMLLGNAADFEYLKRAAESVGVTDLLGKLLSQT